MSKEIGRFYKHNWYKLSTPTLKKDVLSSSASHKLSSINSTWTSISSRLDNEQITINQSKNNISNTDEIQSCVTPRINIYSVLATNNPTHLTSLNDTLHIPLFKLLKDTKLSPACKKYLCFQINGKSSQAAECVKSRIMTNVIDSILSIDTFKQQGTMRKGILQSSSLKNNMKTIGIDQSLRNSASF